MAQLTQKRIALINDISGFGRCSMSVSLPIISKLKVQACFIPTSIFSNHCGYDHFFFDDYTNRMEEYISHWKQLDLQFDGIASGFLGSKKQIQIVMKFIEDFKTSDTKIIIDPVMGDHGKPYSTYTPEMCQEMKKLVQYATILTPNLTEACILTDTPYKASGWTKKELFAMAETLLQIGAKKVVISGVPMNTYLGNVVAEVGTTPSLLTFKRVGEERSGTGDIFASILAADAINDVDFKTSVRKASTFIKKCILASAKYHVPKTDGVCFEEVLSSLK